MVRADTRAARRKIACRDRARRRRRPRLVLGHRIVDDGVDIRSPSRRGHISRRPHRGERPDRHGRIAYGSAETDTGHRTAQPGVSRSGRCDGCLHAQDRSRHGLSGSGHRRAAGLERPDRMAASLGDYLYAAYRSRRGHLGPRARHDGARRAGDGGHRPHPVAGGSARAATDSRQCNGWTCGNDPACRQRERQHMELRCDTARRADEARAGGSHRADVVIRS